MIWRCSHRDLQAGDSYEPGVVAGLINRPDRKCEGCGEPHWLRDCTTTSARMKERIWALTAGMRADATGGTAETSGKRRAQRDIICADCFGKHPVTRCPVPGKVIGNRIPGKLVGPSARLIGRTGAVSDVGDHLPHGCKRVTAAMADNGWKCVFRRTWCFGCSGTHPLYDCRSHSPTIRIGFGMRL